MAEKKTVRTAGKEVRQREHPFSLPKDIPQYRLRLLYNTTDDERFILEVEKHNRHHTSLLSRTMPERETQSLITGVL